MKVYFIAAEGSPFVKTGGLGDVIGSLPHALQKENIETRVVLPLYNTIDREKYNLKFLKYIFVDLGWRHSYCGIFEAKVGKVKFYFIDNEQYFARGKVYGEYDDGERFAFFSKASIEILPHIDFKPDIINANDWHSALSIIYLDRLKSNNDEFYKNIKSVISIHNIEFQGEFDPYILGSLFGLENKYYDSLIYNGCINLLKGAIQLSDGINTVSNTYSKEILTPYFSYKLDKILNIERYKLRGIVNGIDTDKFNPSKDSNIYKKYNKVNVTTKKFENKLALQRELNLEVSKDKPMIGMVTRLTHQKGIDLVLEVADKIVDRGVQLVILGTGDRAYEDALISLERRFPNNVRSLIKFSNELSSKIYASCDMFLMPSKTEPCGLSQLISMKYATVPIVHRVGGLKDTVIPYNTETKKGLGFTFETFNAYDMLNAVNRALDLYYTDKKEWKNLIKQDMKVNVDWSNSAKEYIKMYKEI